MPTPVKTKDLGIDEPTGLQKELQVWRIEVDAKAETVNVYYDIVLKSNGVAAAVVESNKNYLRYNRPAEVDAEGNEIRPANMKFDALRSSPVGQGVEALIQQDINNYPDIDQE